MKWLRCNVCGWEHEEVAMVNQCGNCGTRDSLHIISDRDGEQPKQLDAAAIREYDQGGLAR